MRALCLHAGDGAAFGSAQSRQRALTLGRISVWTPCQGADEMLSLPRCEAVDFATPFFPQISREMMLNVLLCFIPVLRCNGLFVWGS